MKIAYFLAIVVFFLSFVAHEWITESKTRVAFNQYADSAHESAQSRAALSQYFESINTAMWVVTSDESSLTDVKRQLDSAIECMRFTYGVEKSQLKMKEIESLTLNTSSRADSFEIFSSTVEGLGIDSIPKNRGLSSCNQL